MGARRAASLLWPSAALAATLAAWLFLPRGDAPAPTRARLRVVLVDASASVARAPDWLPWVRAELRREAVEARSMGEELAVLSYADGLATGFTPGSPARFLERLEGRSGAPFDPGLELERGATRLADALGGLEPLLDDPTRPRGRLVLLAPPTYSGASPAAALARLAACTESLTVHAPPRATVADLGLLELVLAPRIEAGAPLIALARLVFARGPARAVDVAATLELELECDGVTRSFARELPLPAAGGEFELPIECGPAGFGRNELRARCRLARGPDLFPENDRARASALAEGARLVGVAVAEDLREHARAWLTPAGHSALSGLQFHFVAPRELGGALEQLAALVTFDLAPDALPEPLLAAFVHRGGGWLALSGWGFLDGWIPGETGGLLQGLLPCEPAQSAAPPRDVVLLVDGSGSMEGEPFESVRAATLELVSAALPSDRVSLRFFTVNLEREHLLKARSASRAEDEDAARRAARELLALRVPAGTTFLLRSLRELAASAGEHETLALLLTDGWERDALPDELGLARSLAQELAGARIRLVVIAVGQPNLELLATLAGGAERVRSGRTLEDLRSVFHRELHGPRLAEGELDLAWAARTSGSLADEVVSAASATPALAPLERYVRNRLRPGGEALWESVAGEPVLALARAGLGRTALFASRPTLGWASRYVRPGLGQPAEFEGLLRWLARGPERAESPRARIEAGRLVVTGLQPGTPAELRARLVDLDDSAAAVELTLLPPGDSRGDVWRTRQARLGPRELREPVLLLSSAALGGEQALPVELSLADEYAWREREVPAAWLAPRPASSAASAAESPSSHASAPWGMALAILLIAVAGLVGGRAR